MKLIKIKIIKKKNIRPPGIEPEADAWKASMLPLHHERLCYTIIDSLSNLPSIFLIIITINIF
jgi:hypothetical protein